MIIEAKSTQKGAEPIEPRKKFDFNKPEKTSRVPLYFALLITGVAAYLKSAFPAFSLSHEGNEPTGASGDGSNAPHGARAEAALLQYGEEIDEIITGSVEDGPPPNTVTSTGIPWSTHFDLPEAPSLTYATLLEPFSPQLLPFFPAVFAIAPNNDNALPQLPAIAMPGVGAVRDRVDHGTDDPSHPVDHDDGGDEDEDEDEDDTENTPGNRAPITSGAVRLHDVFAGQVILIGLSQLLFGAFDPDGDVLSVNDITVTGGTLVQISDGWSLATLPGMLGVITITYDISDGLLEVVQTAMLDLVRRGHQLTADDDVYAGTIYDDDIDGLGGSDIIDARAGNDVVVGAAGDDHINGGDGDDQLFGGLGNDVIFGGAGNDLIGGGAGNDRLFGQEGNDIINGDDGDDTLMGGTGDDVLNGGAGNDLVLGDEGDDAIAGGDGDDTLAGGAGDDVLLGDAGADILDGGDGDDVLIGGAGDDQLRGGAGDDHLFGDAGDDTIDGGDGHDVLDYSGFTADIYIDLGGGTATSSEIGLDIIKHFEEVIGGAGDDTIVVGSTATIISGGQGDDLFIFTVTDDDASLSQALMHEILDFVVGDHVRVANYDISNRAERSAEQRFEELYEDLDDGFEGNLPIRVRHERYDDMDHTIIEADLDRNDVYEISINLHGVVLPLFIETHIA